MIGKYEANCNYHPKNIECYMSTLAHHAVRDLQIRKCLFVVIIAILFLTGSLANAYSLNGYNYQYKQVVNLSGNSSWSGNQTNYAVMFTVHSGNGTSSRSDIYLNNHSLEWTNNFFPSDLVPIDNGGNMLNYWFETTAGNISTVPMWVNTSTLYKTGNTTISFLYGNSTANVWPNLTGDIERANGSTLTGYAVNTYGTAVTPSVVTYDNRSAWHAQIASATSGYSGSDIGQYNTDMKNITIAKITFRRNSVSTVIGAKNPQTNFIGAPYFDFYFNGTTGVVFNIMDDGVYSQRGTNEAGTFDKVTSTVPVNNSWETWLIVIDWYNGYSQLYRSTDGGSTYTVLNSSITAFKSGTWGGTTQPRAHFGVDTQGSYTAEAWCSAYIMDDGNTYGERTFPFFDTFPGPTLDTSKWTNYISSGSQTIYNGTYTQTGSNDFYVGSASAYPVNYRARTYMQSAHYDTTTNVRESISWYQMANPYYFSIMAFAWDGSSTGAEKYRNYNGTNAYQPIQSGWVANTYGTVNYIRNDSTGTIGIINGGTPTENNVNFPTSSYPFVIETSNGGSETFAWVALMPYIYPEPSVVGWSGEIGGFAPIASFDVNQTSGAAPLSISFTDTSTNAPTSWNWSVTNVSGNNTPFYFSTSKNPTLTLGPGNWSAALNASNGYGTNLSAQVTWINVSTATTAPVANFTGSPISGVVPLNVSFTDTSTNAPTSWLWDFGDGTTAIIQNPYHIYISGGLYSVNMEASNSAGSSWKNQTNYINATSPGSDPNPYSHIQFNAAATGQIANQTPYVATSRIANLSSNTSHVTGYVTYDPVYYSVSNIRLNTTDISGTTLDSSSVGNGYFTYNISKASNFTASSSGASLIDFNITNIKYANPGTAGTPFNYTGANTRYYDPGNSTWWSFNLITGITPSTGVWGPINATFTGSPTLVGVGSAVTFTDASTGYPDAWSWDFGDYSTSMLQNPLHAYSTAGLYTVTETAYMSENASVTSTLVRTNYINVSSATVPVAAFTGSPLNVTLGSAVTFTDQSTGSPSSWTWAFGDSSGSSAQNPSHTYTSVGNYTVNLTVSNFLGSNTLSKTNYIHVQALAAPVASFTSNVSSGGAPLSVSFTDTSTNNPTSWIWDYSSGGGIYFGSNNQNWNFTFTMAGNYTVNLTASNAAGSNISAKYINVSSLSGIVRQDLLMDPIYTKTITFVDSSGNIVPVVSVSDSTGYNETTTAGVFTHSYPYSTVAVYYSSTGYVSGSRTFAITKDSADTIVLTAASTQNQNTNIVYYPTQIEFILYTSSGNPLSGAYIAATPLNFTAPSNWTTLLLGINSNVNITGTTVSGYTGSDGTWAAPMLASNQYRIDISGTYNNASYSYSITLYPAVTPVQLTIPVGVKAIPTSAAGIITYSLTNTSINSTAQYVRMTYSDTSLSTSTLVFWVKNATGYPLYSTTYTGSSANSQTFNQTFAVQMGQSYTYGIAADTSNFEDPWINQTASFNINYQIGLLGQSPGTVELWLAIAILVMWGAIGSIYFKHIVLIGEPILYWFIAQYFGWLPLTAYVYTTMGVMIVLGVLIYIRYKENMIT